MKPHVQIVGRLPAALKRRVQTAARREKVSVNTFLINALTQAIGGPRVARVTKGA